MKIEVVQCGMCKHYDSEQYCEVWEQYITNDAFYCACGAKTDHTADTPQTEVTKEDFIEQIKDARLEIKPLTVCNITECDYHKYCKERGQTDCGWK